MSKRRYAYPIISVLFISGIVLWQVNKHAAIYAGVSLLVLLLIVGHKWKHPIATPFARLSLTAGVACLVVNSVLNAGPHPQPTPLGWSGEACVAVALLTPLLAALFRLLHRCFREVMDCVWVVRRGVLSPIQVRQEFIETVGREPTIAEVHDLYEMIKSEYNHAILTLGGIVAAGYIFNRGVKGKGLFS